MNYGRFFSLDVNASQLANGIAVFNYRGVKKRGVKVEDDNIRKKYPIYASFSNEGVSFHVHNIEEEENKGVKITKQHTNSLILSLPISTNLEIKDNLTSCIASVFRNNFPNNGHKNTLYDYAAASLKNSEIDGKGITYSSLEVFGLIYNRPEDIERPPIVGMLRKLFLDFLYDLEHTSVFKNAYNYEAIYIALNENFLFRAIKSKAEYYYQRKMVSAPREEGDTPFDVADREILMADHYVETERRWVETITDHRSEATFHMANGWLLDAEQEMNAVYESDVLSFYKKSKRIEPKSEYKTLRCSDFIKRIRFSKSEPTADVKYNKKCVESSKESIVDTAKAASNWYIHKYSFSGTLRIWYGKSYWIRTTIFVIAIALLILSIASPSWIGQSNGLSIAVGVMVLLSLWRIISLSKDRLKRVGSINLLMPRLFAAITTAWFTLAIGEDVFKGFFDTIHSYWASGALLLVTFFFVAYEIGKINPFISLRKIVGRSFALIGVAFIYSFIAGLLVVHFFGSRYLERSDYIDEFYANEVFIETPNYIIAADSVQSYVHNHFYGLIAKYDKTLMNSIKTKDIEFVDIDSQCVIDYLSKSLNVQINNKSYPVKYGVTVKLLSIFNAQDSILNDSDMIKELHQHMIEGSLLSHRVAKVKCFVDSIKGKTTIAISDKDLSNIHFDSIIVDKGWREMLKSIDNNTVYREALKHLVPSSSERQAVVSEYIGINIFRELLLQFTFFAMFIGIFLQLIFEEKPVTEPI